MPMDTFYFDETEKPVVDYIKKIAKADNRSKSEIIVLALKEYCEKHNPNYCEKHNPNSNQQSLLDLNDVGQKSVAFNRDKIFKVLLAKFPKEINYKMIIKEIKKYYKDSEMVTSISFEISKLLIDKDVKILR